jgi:aminopeptidase N
LQPGDVNITIEYQAPIGDSMAGFFRAKYRLLDPSQGFLMDGKDAVVLATQFEPCHARWAFPCFDVPNLKATFDLSLEVAQELTALSNMPVKQATKLPGINAGLQRVEFERTPVMSTYVRCQ